ncbi:hypothetical protein [Arsukibacterium indicum]|uniref:Uncharacterized protein n=1 Tax=Arsukibacterium indicum TaxID=2848612 RepID=A0ABS6MGL7_9GAMM|nr:hypothetical protein [Arsukibacterium indicum]MBV2127953.1 hypothetical protein [Arsukibacterium indicum]
MPATTNAALKMSSPGEPCSQLLKMMAYCKTEAKSIRAMKKHLAVTDAVVHQLLADALQRGLLRKQPNGMYKTLKDAQPANESLLALANKATDGETAAAAAETQQPTDLPDPDEEVIELDMPEQPEPGANVGGFTAELDNLAGLLQPDQYPVIDDIADKQRALSGISLIIKPHAPQLVNVLDQLAADLAVICLHQNRRA